MTTKQALARAAVPLAIVVAGVALANTMSALAPEATRGSRVASKSAVRIVKPGLHTRATTLSATGTVEPSQRIEFVPEVAGRVVWVSPSLAPGARFAKGEVFARIENRDFQIRVQQARAQVRSAELELELEKGRQEVARREWELLGSDRPADDAPLATRQSHLEVAEVGLASAKSALDQAELTLARTVLRAPFDCSVVSEAIDVGQYVAPGSSIANLIGTKTFRIRVGLRVEDLTYLQVPGFNSEVGSTAKIVQRLGRGQEISRPGTVTRLIEQLDPQSRRALVLVEVEDPLTTIDEGSLPLLAGAFVDVTFRGKELANVIPVPREAVQQGHFVWTVRDGKLHRNRIEIAWDSDESVFASGGLSPNDAIVTSALSNPVDGQEVEVELAPTAQADQGVNHE